jgi:hypothetical protein
MISISNNERGQPPARRPSLKEPSPMAIKCFKIEIAHDLTPLTPSPYNMHTKLRKHNL